MPVEFVETLVADNADVGEKKATTWDFLLSEAVTSSEESPVGYESDNVVYVTFVSEDLADDEARWDKQFAESQELMDKLADEALAEHLAGLTEEFDPDNDSDIL
jgi:hypothetical protein